ncbi:hypothetical protein PYW07_014932 [Mythimna separata]|uniref:Uncharacterized protein n=1 Tax=Mythimna separata TaxID=271217 RepID=A0AAD8E0K7_MYTSE|nr:hypothetical protein PYW07_014932 [Mythimna separata]
MASVLWDAEGNIIVEYLKKGPTIMDSYYADQKRRLRQVIKEKKRCKLRVRVLFHQNNAPAHKPPLRWLQFKKRDSNCLKTHLIRQTWHPVTYTFFFGPRNTSEAKKNTIIARW